MPRAFLCDFDGTIAPTDIGAAVVKRFSRTGDRERAVLLERWMAGEIGHRALSEAECASMTVEADEALAFARGFGIDPAFAGFVREVEARGDRVMVVSEGFDFYVADQLERAGLGALPRAANRARFEGGGVRIEFPFGDRGCGHCGNCKAQHVADHRDLGYEVVMVGDGLSDRCGARAADRVFARGSLLDWCRAERIEAATFRDFDDVAALARGLQDAGGAARAAGS